jgi:hypothetical protein
MGKCAIQTIHCVFERSSRTSQQRGFWKEEATGGRRSKAASRLQPNEITCHPHKWRRRSVGCSRKVHRLRGYTEESETRLVGESSTVGIPTEQLNQASDVALRVRAKGLDVVRYASRDFHSARFISYAYATRSISRDSTASSASRQYRWSTGTGRGSSEPLESTVRIADHSRCVFPHACSCNQHRSSPQHELYHR